VFIYLNSVYLSSYLFNLFTYLNSVYLFVQLIYLFVQSLFNLYSIFVYLFVQVFICSMFI